MAVYNPKSLKAEEFINDEEIRATLAYAAENYPAREYALIIWNHGGGPLEGVCYDELYNSHFGESAPCGDYIDTCRLTCRCKVSERYHRGIGNRQAASHGGYTEAEGHRQIAEPYRYTMNKAPKERSFGSSAVRACALSFFHCFSP